MGIFDNPGRSLRHLERALWEEEPRRPESPEEPEEDDEEGFVNYATEFDRAYYADEVLDDESVYYEEDYRAEKRAKKRRKRGCSWGLILFLELLGIGAVIGWWVKWLS